MNKISVITMLSAILLSINSSIVLASAVSDSSTASVQQSSEQTLLAEVNALQQQGKFSLALDKLVASGQTQSPEINYKIRLIGITVYTDAVNGTGEFSKETGGAYLKRHASLPNGGFAKSILENPTAWPVPMRVHFRH